MWKHVTWYCIAAARLLALGSSPPSESSSDLNTQKRKENKKQYKFIWSKQIANTTLKFTDQTKSIYLDFNQLF